MYKIILLVCVIGLLATSGTAIALDKGFQESDVGKWCMTDANEHILIIEDDVISIGTVTDSI